LDLPFLANRSFGPNGMIQSSNSRCVCISSRSRRRTSRRRRRRPTIRCNPRPHLCLCRTQTCEPITLTSASERTECLWLSLYPGISSLEAPLSILRLMHADRVSEYLFLLHRVLL
jgi:hypothetical protein